MARLGYQTKDLVPHHVKEVGSAKAGAALQVLGKLPDPMDVRFKGVNYNLAVTPVVLKDLSMDMNIAGPTLQEWGVSQHHKDSCVEVNGTRIKLIPPAKSKHTEVAMVMKYDTIVQPHEEVKVELIAPAYENLRIPLGEGCLEGSEVFEIGSDLHTYKQALVKGTPHHTIVAGLWNSTEDPITVKKGARYGTFYPLEAEDPIYSICSLGRNPGTKDRHQPAVPEPTNIPAFMKGKTNDENRKQRIRHILNEFKIGEDQITRDPETKGALIALLLKHFNLFAWDGEYGRTNLIEHQILLKGDAHPFKARYRLLNPHMEEQLDEQLDKWLDTDVIEPTNSPWSAPLVPVKKKSTPSEPVKFRWCVDYRELNSRTVQDACHIGDCFANLTRLSGSKVFSTLDASGAFHQIMVEEKSRPLTAFSTHRGSFRFKCLPFGVINGPATYARLVQMVLSGVAPGHVLPYLDDILIHSPTIAEHFTAVDQVLEAHSRAGLKLNPLKCHFFQQAVTYLGHKVTAEGTAPVPEYVSLVQEWPLPTNKTELRAFIGKAAYYRRFIKDFAMITEPLYEQLKDNINKGRKGNIDNNSPAFLKAFQEVKDHLTSAPVLAHPRFNDPKATWILDTDWSRTNNACGMVLSQVQDGVERPIAFHGIKLKDSQKNYAATKGELAGVILGLKKFKYFLVGTEFTLRTDHKALEAITKLENPEPVVTRWLEALATFRFKPVYRPGPKHGNADSLSRRPNLPTSTEELEDAEIANINNLIPISDYEVTTKEDLKRHQANDLDLQAAIDPSGKPSSSWHKKTLAIKDGLIFVDLPGETQDRIQVLALPRSLLQQAVRKAHMLVAHRGVAATLAALRSAFDSPLARQATEKEIGECLNCQLKTKPSPQRALHRPKTAEGPFQSWSCDFVGPLPPSGVRRHTYVLTMIDMFTKWPEAFPCTAATAEVVITHLTQDIFPRFGLPATLHSDRGTHFVAAKVKEVAKRLGIRMTTTPAYHPASNPVERFNQDLGKGINALAGREQNKWAEKIPEILRAARATPHRGTQLTPFELVFGRKPQLARVLIPEVQIREPSPKEIRELEARARENLQEYYLQKQKYYKGTVKDFPVGTLVSLFTPVLPTGTSGKFKSNFWTYPFRVVEKISDLVYKIETTKATEGLPSPQVVTIDRLRKYKDGKEEPRPNRPLEGKKRDSKAQDQEDEDLEGPLKKRVVVAPAEPGSARVTSPSCPRAASPQDQTPTLPPRTPLDQLRQRDAPARPRRSPRLAQAARAVGNLPQQAAPFLPQRTSTEGVQPPPRPLTRTERMKEELEREKKAAATKTRLQQTARDERYRHRSGEDATALKPDSAPPREGHEEGQVEEETEDQFFSEPEPGSPEGDPCSLNQVDRRDD